MNRGFAILVATFLIATLHSATFAQSRPSNKPIELQVISLSDGKRITFVRFNLDAFTLRILSPLVSPEGRPIAVNNRERSAQGLFLADYEIRYDTVAVVSGGYIERFSPPTPLGFVKSQGIVVNRPHESWLTDGMLCAGETHISIDAAGRVPDRPQFRDCLQAGPLLLKQGSPVQSNGNSAGYQKLAKSVQEQTFVCTSDRHGAVLGVTDKMDMTSLQDSLTQTALSCRDALRLTGHETSGLRFEGKLTNKDDFLFPTAVGVVARRR